MKALPTTSLKGLSIGRKSNDMQVGPNCEQKMQTNKETKQNKAMKKQKKSRLNQVSFEPFIK